MTPADSNLHPGVTPVKHGLVQRQEPVEGHQYRGERRDDKEEERDHAEEVAQVRAADVAAVVVGEQRHDEHQAGLCGGSGCFRAYSKRSLGEGKVKFKLLEL